MNKIKTIIILAISIPSFFCQLTSLAEQGDENNTEKIIITDIKTVANSVQNIHMLWPENYNEYFEVVKQITDLFYMHEENQMTQTVIRQLFDTTVSLQTIYGNANDSKYISFKKEILRHLLFRSRTINSDPEKWCAVAKFIGQMKEEIRPIDYGYEILTNKSGIVYAKARVWPKTQEERDKKRAEDLQLLSLGNYQTSLENGIRSLTSILVNYSHMAEFDDDAKREEYKEKLVKLAKLSDEDANKMNVDKRAYINAPTTVNPAQSLKSEK